MRTHFKGVPDWDRCIVANIETGKSWVPVKGKLKTKKTIDLGEDLYLTREEVGRALTALDKAGLDNVLVIGFCEATPWRDVVSIKVPWDEVTIDDLIN